jgi:hypothetical protein
MLHQQSFNAALRRGDRAALESFYDQLRGQVDDQGFWQLLEQQLPAAAGAELLRKTGPLRASLSAGDFAGFLRSAPAAAVLTFLSLALLTGCQSAGSASGPAAASGASAAVAPAGAPAVDGDAAPEQTFENVRARLLDYINRAQLPASEKRRLKAALRETEDVALLQSRTELDDLFAQQDPKEIAARLETLVLFHAETTAAPENGFRIKAVTKYKGVNFDPLREPAITTLARSSRPPRPTR